MRTRRRPGPTPATRAARGGVVLLVPALLALLAGCGGQDAQDRERAVDEPSTSATTSASASASASGSPSRSSEPVPAGAPACERVWVEGETLPRGYAGCADGKQYVAVDPLPCSSGQRLVSFERSYGVLGGEVRRAQGPLEDDRAYVQAVRSCRG